MALARRSAALPSTARLMDKGLLHAACCMLHSKVSAEGVHESVQLRMMRLDTGLFGIAKAWEIFAHGGRPRD